MTDALRSHLVKDRGKSKRRNSEKKKEEVKEGSKKIKSKGRVQLNHRFLQNENGAEHGLLSARSSFFSYRSHSHRTGLQSTVRFAQGSVPQ